MSYLEIFAIVTLILLAVAIPATLVIGWLINRPAGQHAAIDRLVRPPVAIWAELDAIDVWHADLKRRISGTVLGSA
jgi:hypothetical protein